AARRKSAGRAGPVSSTTAKTKRPAHPADQPAPANARSFAANVRPPCTGDKNRAPPANRSRETPAGSPSTIRAGASVAAPRQENRRQEFPSASPTESPG